jgi:hypothetical protein
MVQKVPSESGTKLAEDLDLPAPAVGELVATKSPEPW